MSDCKHLDFMDTLREVAAYGLDEPRGPNAIVKPEDFFKDLYVHTHKDNERDIESTLSAADRFTLLVAPRGGGKTSIVRNALRKTCGPKCGHFLFDFQVHIEKCHRIPKNSDDARILFITTLLKKALANHFLGGIETKIAYIYEALSQFYREERLHLYIFQNSWFSHRKCD